MKNWFGFSLLCLVLGLTLKNGALAPQTSAVAPLVDVPSGFLLGGSRGGQWLDAKTTARALPPSASYRLFSATRLLGQGRGDAPKSQGPPCPDTLFTRISPNKNAEFALGGLANPLPRRPRIESVHQPAYRAVVAAILKSRGIARPRVKITQIWRVDLEGDGNQEVLLTATNKLEYNNDPRSISAASRAGDYSLLLLRRLVRGKVENRILEGEFYPRARTFNAPSFYRLAAVLDANGDGKMEILLRGRYYEGEWTSLYSVEGHKPRAVLSAACGA